MARDHAVHYCSMWEDDTDFLALSDSAKLLYFFLTMQRELTYAGLLPLRLRRWTSKMNAGSVEAVTAALAELDARRFVVVDHDAEEVLVRSLIRRDGIYKQPQILAAALRAAFAASSAVVRGALAAELRRLPVEVTGPAPAMAAEALLSGARELPPVVKAAMEQHRREKSTKTPAATKAGSTAPVARRATRPARPAAAPAAEAVKQSEARPAVPELDPRELVGAVTANPAGNPSGDPSAQAQGEGGRGKGCVVPVLLSASSVQGGVARTRESAPTREDAAQLVAEVLPGQPAKVATRLVTEVAALLAEGIEAQDVEAGLRLWAGKSLGVGLLAELVGEAMRAPQIDAAANSRPPRGPDERVANAFALAAQYATEDGDDTELGRLLRAAAGTGASGMGALLSGAAA
ncbi:hypothetical protein [Lentzea sp. NBRC 102530]|uniref:hypothetical protein n=1 Tax=Lentzea sp. NBRC 102530 TaxID=3032201 RepID=UPI0024A0CEBE|nr:hypothetical protein [Lentzea sp. NBRC 102530]GLY51320.1 hypothetical protein Lesp01_49760 [Lentzea sp. NBRC 102530]